MNVFTSAFTARSKVVEIGPKKPLSLHYPRVPRSIASSAGYGSLRKA